MLPKAIVDDPSIVLGSHKSRLARGHWGLAQGQDLHPLPSPGSALSLLPPLWSVWLPES